MGCHLSIERLSENDIAVTGNRCARGEQYAREEMLSPRRVVTATCKVAPSSIATTPASIAAAAPIDAVADLSKPRRIPLRTKAAFPRERIPELLALIYGLEMELPVRRGQAAIADALGTGIDVIVARTM